MGLSESTSRAPASTATNDGSPPGATSDSPARDSVVAVDEVKSRTGPIPVTGRYVSSNSRLLDTEYKLESKVVGSGMSGPVQLATGKMDGRKYAVKSFKKRGLSSRKRTELKNEVEIYLALDHPHVARLEMVFETDEELHLVMEYMAGGELYDRLSSRKQYTEEGAASTTHQMLLSLAYLHANKVAHRDLKLENFLYQAKDSDHLKLIDFGFAKHWDRSVKMSQACGSVHYVAPEVLAHSYTEKADVWSLAVIVYMLLTGSPPFHGSDDEVLRKIRAGKPHYSTRFHRLSDPAKSFVQALLVVNPAKRLSAQEALEHPWVAERHTHKEALIDSDILFSLRNFAHSSHFKRAVLSMMAWSLSAEDRSQLHEQFLSMDTENKGTITHNQMRSILEENFHVDSKEAEALFTSLDVNNDNEINYSEFLAAALQGRVKVHEDVLRKTFSRFDHEGVGLITASDLRSVLGDDFEGESVEELISEADTTGDGKIDYDEFLAYFHRPVPVIEEGEEEAAADLSRKSQKHTEQLGILLDRLIIATESSEDLAELAGQSPKTPRPLCRRANRAKTCPAPSQRGSSDMNCSSP